MSNTQYSTIPARAYKAALTVISKRSVVSEISTTIRKSWGAGFVLPSNPVQGRFNTIKSGIGSLFGSSSGETLIGASGATYRKPNTRTSQFCSRISAFTCGRFFGILLIRLPFNQLDFLMIKAASHFKDRAIGACKPDTWWGHGGVFCNCSQHRLDSHHNNSAMVKRAEARDHHLNRVSYFLGFSSTGVTFAPS